MNLNNQQLISMRDEQQEIADNAYKIIQTISDELESRFNTMFLDSGLIQKLVFIPHDHYLSGTISDEMMKFIKDNYWEMVRINDNFSLYLGWCDIYLNLDDRDIYIQNGNLMEVIEKLNLTIDNTELLSVIANLKKELGRARKILAQVNK